MYVTVWPTSYAGYGNLMEHDTGKLHNRTECLKAGRSIFFFEYTDEIMMCEEVPSRDAPII